MKTTILTFAIALLATVPVFAATSVTKQACSSPNTPATADQVYYDMPSIAAELGMSGTSVVKVDLNTRGDVTSQTLFTSSGIAMLDDAAMRSARHTRFTAELRNCERVAGTYLYAVEF